MLKGIALSALLALAPPAWAEDGPDAAAQDSPHPTKLRDLCSDRPGLNIPACTVDPGHLQVEVGLADWTLERKPDTRTDTIEASEIALRYGVGGTTELRLAWTAYGHVRERDRQTGAVDRTAGVGDVTVGLKQNLRHPAEGETGLGLALLPYAILPTGRRMVGAGTWAAGLDVPASYKLSDVVQLELTPEVDAAADESGHGRHLVYGTAFGMQVHLTKTVRLTPEMQFLRDRDPEHHATEGRAALSLDFQPQKMTQLDVQAIAGLNRRTPAVELMFGATHKF